MKEQSCIFLSCTNGKPKGKTIPSTPPEQACAICYAKKEADCIKTRAKFRITPKCWRVRIIGGG